MNKIPVLILLLAALLTACTDKLPGERSADPENISLEFSNPGSDYRPGAFWCWLNGNISKKAISYDLKEMSEKGMGRAEIWDVAAVNNPGNYIPAGPAFLSDSSVSLIKHAFAEGEKYNIKIGMVGSSGWNAGGTWVEPGWASKALYYSDLILEGAIDTTLTLPFPELPSACPRGPDGNPLFSKEVAVLAFPYNEAKHINSTENIINLSDSFSNGSLKAILPEGKWLIIRFLCSNNGQKLIVPSPQSGGLFIDFLDPEATSRHLKHIIDRLGIKADTGNKGGLAYLEFDSMELAEGIPWTDSMPSVFKSMRAYDLTSYLPALIGWKIGNDSERFLYDWKKTISDQLIYSHYTTGREFLKKYNIELVAEAGGPGPPTWDTCPVDALKALGNVSVPRGEFWVQHRNIFLVKEVASASHIYGRKIVDAESFTTWRRWKDSPYDLKKIVDRAFCEGLNNVTFHTFASTGPDDGLPGRTYHAGSDINHANTWWNKSKPFMDYLSRCSYMLQQGLFVADVCYYYGDKAPNFYPAYHVVPEKPMLPGLGKGYDFDVVNSDVILNRMSVKDKRIVLPDGLSYSLLLLPDQADIPLEVLQKLEAMVKAGATIMGNKPLGVPGLHSYTEKNRELSGLADKMWEGIDGEKVKINKYGKGRVVYGMEAGELLESDRLGMDFSADSAADLDYIHRQTGDMDIYFIRNISEEKYSGICKFRVTGKYPEIWDPATGEQFSISEYTEEFSDTSVPVRLSAGGSVFIVFNRKKRELPILSHAGQSLAKETIIEGPWEVSFSDGWGAPGTSTFDSLISWTESDIKGIRYYSGTAAYHKKISFDAKEINSSGRIMIDLGDIGDLAEVFVNNSSAGILWKKPYLLDITELLKAGSNDLRIEIVNQWVNRLTGDMLSAPSERYCRTNQPYITRDDMGFDNWPEGGDETFRLKRSGLFGPVLISSFPDQ
ncbi:MAG: glycosyl hydrolase [Marinilabiliaceae bacterium]|jgi:hypothetical protein|nr:glycosyl hydrolase [Marinilabiliaceae bacterium]